MKKALALFLTLALLISMLPTAALAVEDKTQETTSEAQSAEEQVVTEEEPSAVYEEVEEEPDPTAESGEDVSETVQPDETASDEQAAPDIQEDPDVQKKSENEEVGTPTQEEMVEEVSTPEETVSQAPAAAQEETAIVASGACGDQGDNLTWTLDSAGTLTITGSGAMMDFGRPEEDGNCAPWYSYNSQIKTVVLEPGITYIGCAAFYGFGRLRSIAIPDGVTSIGDSAFNNCGYLSSITIPDSVICIGDSAFYYCGCLTSITIPDSVIDIGNYAFYKCFNLTNIRIPKSITSIGSSVFDGCSRLTSIALPEGLTSIGDRAFQYCSSLTDILLPDNVTNIGDCAFNGCTSLISIVLPNSVINIGNFAFNGCTSLTSIVLPDSLTSIGDDTFMGCTSLISIAIPDSVTSVGNYAFNGCSALTNVDLPNSVTNIGTSAFNECTSLTSIVLPDSLTSIGDATFMDCTSLISIVLPDSVTSVGNYAFNGCSALTNVDLPEGVTSIGELAFQYCSSLTNIVIPNSVTSIGNQAFQSCSRLTSIMLPEGVITIGHYAFQYCSSLVSIVIPSSITHIGGYAFYGCSNLTDIYYTGSKDEWSKIVKYEYENLELFNATIHYNSVGPDGGGGTSNSDSFRFGGYSSEGDDSGADYAMINAEADAVLQGILEVNDEQDIQTEFDSIVWTVSDPSVAEITDSKLGEEDLVGSHWTVSVKGLRPGTVTVTGTTRDGRTASKEITVEPQMVIDVPETISMATDVTCTVYLNEPDAAFLEQYMQQLDSSFTCGADDYYLPSSVPVDVPGKTVGTDEFFADISYSVAANGLSAVYTISVLPNGRWGSLTGQINFVAGSGFSRSASTTLYMSNAQFNFLNIDGSEDDWPKTSIAWENGHYDLTEITAKLTITYYPTDGISKASVDKISFSLDNLGLFKIDGESVIEPNIQLAPGESYSCTVTLVKRGMFWQKPDEGETWTGTINAVIDGVFPNASMQNDLSLTVDISRPVEDSEENTDSEQEKLDQEIVSGAEDAINAFYDLDDKIALNEQIYADQWLGKDAAEALRVLIYTEISLASMSEEIWQKEGSLSAKVVDRIFDQYLGNWQLQTGTSTIELPISAYFRNARNQRIQCDVICTVDGYTFNQQLYGITANIVIKLTNMDTYQISTFYGSMLSKADIQTFAEAAWSVASAELRSGYKNVWASGVDEEISKLAEDSIEYLASKATSYGFEETVKVILKRFYEDKLGSVFSSQTFQLLTYPSKMAVVHCPVDLFIYDASGALVGSIEGDEVTLTGDKLVLWTEGDDKYVQLFDDSYRIEYVATGTGNMSIEIYDQANGVTNLRMCAYSNIPLEPGLNYTGYVDDEILTDVNNYDLTSSKDNVITASSVTYFEDSAMDCSGTLTSWEADTEATYYLYDDSLTDEEIRADLAQSDHEFALFTGTGSEPSIGTDGRYEQQFSFCDILPGTYKLAIYKTDKYVPQVVTVTVEQTSQDLGNLCLQMMGDVNGDGKVTTIDAALANSCARGASDLEAYALACADVSGNDGKVTVIDAALINAHARGVSSLWG